MIIINLRRINNTFVIKLYRGILASRWPTFGGTILVSEVRRCEAGIIASEKSFYPHIIYQYEVGENQYFDEKISFIATGSGIRSVLQKKVDHIQLAKLYRYITIPVIQKMLSLKQV